MKKHYLALFLVFLTVTALGQSNFYKISLGGSGGGTFAFADVPGKFALAGSGNLDYHFTPFVTAGIEFQKGTLKGGPDKYERFFSNAYMAYNVNVKFRAGQITDFYYSDFLNYTKGFYLGTGIGRIHNKVERNQFQSTGWEFPGRPESINFLIPVNIGFDFYFPDGWGDIRYILNINYQANVTFGEGIDGYDDTINSVVRKSSPPDIYNYLSIGFKYTFGPKGLTGKSIR